MALDYAMLKLVQHDVNMTCASVSCFERLMMTLTKYMAINDLISADLACLETEISNLFNDKNPLNKDLSEFLTAPAKRLRPILGFLFLRSLFDEITPEQRDVLLAVELIHNATLIHDDVIDGAENRRNQKTIGKKFDDNLAVVAGDFLLSVAMEKVIATGSVDVITLCTSALKSTCLGEISQYFTKFSITSIDDYIEKSRNKTALLFEIGVLGGLILENKSNDLLKMATEFSQNFGIAFQIRDDLINVLDDNLSASDVDSGVYTAPVIFAYQENENILNEKNLVEAIKKTQGIEKTKDLMDNYFDKSILAIKNIESNIYKKAISELIELLRAI